jgi:hypothetical protein
MLKLTSIYYNENKDPSASPHPIQPYLVRSNADRHSMYKKHSNPIRDRPCKYKCDRNKNSERYVRNEITTA